MSPEYVMGGVFSVKSDTYSFGVLILEIVSGLKISSPQLIMNFSSLTTYVSMETCINFLIAQTK
jgi:serine/threonine protein kinase